MIVFPDRRLLILTPPHTASRCLHYSLCSKLGAIWRDGPSVDGSVIDHHTQAIGTELVDYKRALVVRNPFSRIVGLWYHLVDWCRYNGDGCCGFREFVQLVQEDRSDRLSYMYRYSISRWLGDMTVDVVIRHENLEESLQSLLETPVELSPVAERMRKATAAYFADETKQLITEWAATDLERWGYSFPG